MARLWEWVSRFISLFRRPHLDRELDEELLSHLEMMVEANMRKGLSLEEARQAARRSFGGFEYTREAYREQRGLPMIETLLQDLRYGLRILRNNPGFTSVAVLSLALGIGANAAIFQMLDAVALRALPVRNPQELAQVRILEPHGRTGNFISNHPDLTYPQWEQLQDSQQSFSGMLAWSNNKFSLSRGGEARSAQGLFVSGDFFNILGIQPALGRVFTAADDRPGCGAASGVVISHQFWQREFGGDPSAVGKSLTLNGNFFEIIGVTPSRFYGLEVGQHFEVAVPICADAVLSPTLKRLENRSDWWLAAIGRLKPGVSLGQATAQLNAISAGLFKATVPSSYTLDTANHYLGFKLGAVPAGAGVSTLRETYSSPLWILMAITGLVLLIACANLANLMLARASAREREIAIRLSLGASRGRLVRQLLSESMLLAAIGGILGALIAGELSRVLISFLSTQANEVYLDLGLDWHVLSFTVGLSILTCVLFGLVPAIRATSGSPGAVMREGGRGLTSNRSGLALRRSLVVSQVALSLVLLIGALLFLETLRNLSTLDPGFQEKGLLISSVDLHPLNIPAERRLEFKKGLLERLRAIPGVESAAEADIVPISGNGRNNNVIMGQAAKGISNVNVVTEGYFKTVGTPILAGRDFNNQDTATSPRVALVNEVFVRRFFDGENPMGKSFHLEVGPKEPDYEYQIVGIVKNTKYIDLREELPPIIYFPESQAEEQDPFPDYLVRSNGSLAGTVASIKSAMAEVNPSIIFNIHRFSTLVDDSLLSERLMATLAGFFGILAALLATIGLYGVMSYTVAQRRNEIGIRMALGADKAKIIRMVMQETGALLIIGLATGAGLALAGAHWTSSLLFGLKPNDIATYAIAIAVLAVIGVVAGFLPAHRAAKVDPMTALRCE
jgi:putative ABC transport system permease protein